MNGSLLVIAPHPDDEILGAGGIMAQAQARGDRVAVVVATDGARSDPDADPATLVSDRRAECEAGLTALLGRPPPLLFLNQPDGYLSNASIDISANSPLARFADVAAPDTILVTDPADGHPDHKAAFGLATRLMSAGVGQTLQVMPVSQRVDGVFDPKGYTEVPVSPFSTAKADAIRCHSSQLDSVSGFTLSPGVVLDFTDCEYLRLAYDRDDIATDAVPADHFDTMFDESSDPWGYDDEPYERDRFARTAAALNDQRYEFALELGCANGALTEHLAPLCQQLLATDVSSSALAAAQRRVGTLANVILRQASLPRQVPDGEFDLIVASDMLYYLGLEGVVSLMGELDRRAAPGCRLLIASYLGETDTRLTGEMSSETAIAHLPRWRRTHAERTDRLRIDVLKRE